MPALSRRDLWVLASVLTLALALRLLFVLVMPAMPIRSDASGYDAAARRLILTGSYACPVGGDLWSEDVFREDAWPALTRMPPKAFAMPGYAWFVAGVYRLWGSGPDRFASVRVAQALIATLTLILVFLVADAVLGRRAAWIALVLNTLYPPNVWVARFLLTETPFAFLLAGQVALMVWADRSRRLAAYASLGVATAAAVYVRPVAAPLPALLLALQVYRRRLPIPGDVEDRPAPARKPRSPRMPAGAMAVRFVLVALVVAALLAPWVARNQRVYGTFMPTTSAAALPPIQGETIVRGLAFPAETIPQLADLGPYGNDDHRFAEEVSARIRVSMPPATAADVRAALKAKARMLGEALTSPFTFFSTPVPVMSTEFLVQVAILAFALAGLWRHRRRPDGVALVGGVPVYFVVVHWQIGMLWSRYLYPMMPFLLVLAAAAFAGSNGRARVGPRRAARHA